MRTNEMKLEALAISIARLTRGVASGLLLLILTLVFVISFANSSMAQEPQARTFSSPTEAVSALVQASRAGDERALEAILGAGKEITSSSDEERDRLERDQFCKKYQEMHRLVQEPDGSTVLYIGAENWPFPIPLVSKNGDWSFDSDRGRQEILFRRIGENEATAIAVCQQFSLTKNEGGTEPASYDPITQFVQSLVSASGNADNKESSAFHGYYFRVVTTDSSPEVSGRSRRGLTLVAYPAEYQSSGVMTFVVTWRGIVYEKDLGPDTTTVAPQIKTRTGSNWHPAA
jgi:Protein of unknown function (DUF2950)